MVRALKGVVFAALLTGSLGARAEQLLMKGGEWRTTITGIGPQPQTMELCFAEMTVERAMSRLATQPNCERRDVRLDGNVATIDILCGTMSTQGTATLSGPGAYHSDLTMHIGTGAQAKTIHALGDAVWIGACKPGQKPMN